jgi:hypothetical protein
VRRPFEEERRPPLFFGLRLSTRLRPSSAAVLKLGVENELIIDEWRREFEAAARRPLRTRWRYALIRTYKPVLDDAPFRAFDTLAEYRQWCEQHVPAWLGYGR